MKAAAATPSDGSTCRRRRRFLTGYGESEVSIKQEPEDDIKDYAETTMNELLGWYGYEKVDSRDTQGLNLQHFASANATSSPASTPEAGSGSEDPAHGGGGGSRPPSGRAASASPTQEGSSLTSDAVARQHQQMIAALPPIPKHPGAPESPNLPPGCIVCAWCQKVGMKLFTLKTPTGCKAFCSEICFTQCRRASFKKNKVCDWCKHVRHTVNYVDFQDGEQQLQFCSDKCLNQYKMNIFCKETQAHLQMHTHLKEAACKMAAGSGPVNLITPDLWLRDCKPQSNGNSQSSNEDAMEESPNSLESHTTTGTTSLTIPAPEHTTVSVSPVVEKKDSKLSCNGTPKERDKIHRRAGRPSSRHSSAKKTEKEDRTHHHTRHRDRAKVDIAKTNPSTPQFSPSPCSRKSSMANGPAPNLSSPPIRTSPRPNHHVHQKQVHHNTHLHSPPGIGMEHTRPPFFPPNLFPSPLHLVAQQQMEAFFRAQQGMGMRPTAPPPPPPPFPFPPWVVPPFPHAPAPPHHPPPPPPPPPTLSAQTSSSIAPAPINYSQPSPKHSSQSVANLPNSSNPTTTQSTTATSLLPPVTVMVPFPVVLPLPVPIPVPIPIPSHLIEKFTKQKEGQKEVTAGEINQSKNTDVEEDAMAGISDSDEMVSPVVSSSSDNTNSRPVDAVVNKVGQHKSWSSVRGEESINICPPLQMDNTSHTGLKFQEVDCRLTDADSRSYSPLSEIITTDDDVIAGEDVLDSDVEPQTSRIFFTSYVDASQRSSLTTALTTAENHVSDDHVGDSRSPSPSQHLVAEKRRVTDLSSSSINAKRKCLRDRVNIPI